MSHFLALLRYRLARSLIHAGLRVMPAGRARSEINAMLWTWNMKVRATLAANEAVQRSPGSPPPALDN